MAGSSVDVDVTIVGAGVVGCAIAHKLSETNARVCVLERHHDVGEEASKSNTGVADCAWECPPGSLEGRLVRRSTLQWEEVCDLLDVPWERCGGLCIARNAEEEAALDSIVAQASANGVPTSRLSRDQALAAAPYVSPDCRGAVEIPEEGVIDSIRLTLGYAEIAALNGVRFLFNQPLLEADRHGREVRELRTPGQRIRTRYVVNAAGLGADTVSRVLGGEEFSIWPRRGEYLLLDREVGSRIDRVITQPPNEHTRGVMVVPSTHGSLLLGPTATDDLDKSDRSTHAEVLDRILDECRTLVPGLDRERVIKNFAGLRPASDRTYRIERSAEIDNLIQACAIRSTGVSGSLGIAEHVTELLADAGLELSARAKSIRRLPRCPRLREAGPEVLAADPLGRTVICACEKVTALEIHDALRARVPARSIAGVAKRTRASWGRCQGAACLSGISFITSQYVDGPAWSIPWSEPGSTLGVDVTRR